MLFIRLAPGLAFLMAAGGVRFLGELEFLLRRVKFGF
jgi:hypothetical protein